MAYAAVSSVLQTLEYLLPVTCMVLRVKKLQTEMFIGKVRQLTSASSHVSIRIHMREALDEANRIELDDLNFLALPAASYVIKLITKKLLFDIYQRKQKMSEKIKEEFEEMAEVSEEVHAALEAIHLFEAELKEFSEKIHAEGFFPLLPSSSTSSEGLEIMSNLSSVFTTTGKLKREMSFLYQKAMQIKDLCKYLSSLLAFLRDSANLCKHHEVLSMDKCICAMAKHAEDFFEEKMFDISLESMLNTQIGKCYNATRVQAIIKVMLEEIFNEYGILLGLEEIEAIKVELKTVYDKALDGKNFQLESISTEVSKHTLIKEDIIVGLSDISVEIVDRLTRQPSRLEIFTIVGMGGIGKTTLAKKVFNHPFTIYHFHCRAWVTVSQVYQARDLLLCLLLSVTQHTDEIYEKNKEQLAECLYRSLKGRRFLIVMDDIWSIKAWDDVKRSFPDDKNGSRILLTSRLKHVATSVNPISPPVCMSLLSIDESWELLQRKVFGEEGCPVELVDVGKQIVKKCQGLPLAIVAVAGQLSHIKKTYECWKVIADNVSSLVISDPEQCQKILALSYNFLPLQLKACFLCIGAFPEDCEIQVEKLINLWLAEGFLDSESSKSPEEVGEDILEDLIERSLVFVGKRSFGGKIKTCQLHDLLRELCLREAEKDKFMHVMKRDSQSFPLDLHNARRLSFHSDFYGDVHLLPSVPYMRSFLCFNVGSGFSPDIFFFHLNFKLLKILDVSFLRFDHFPSQILKLVRLRYLALTATYKLPASLSKLHMLQTLIIHGPWIAKQHGESSTLSLAYWAMPWLRHLHVSVAGSLWVPSFGTKSTPDKWASKNLQTLSKIRFANCTKGHFALLPHLKKLVIYETREDYIAQKSFQCLSNLVFLQELESLKCSFYLQNRIVRRVDCLIPLPSTIKKITFSWSNLPWNDLRLIAMLPKLEVLKIKNYAFRGPKWSPTEDGFRCLKYLLIEKTDQKKWNACNIHFPYLKHLVLRSCELLEEIPFDIGRIPTLELIELLYCSKSAELSAEEIKEQNEGLDVHIHSHWVPDCK